MTTRNALFRPRSTTDLIEDWELSLDNELSAVQENSVSLPPASHTVTSSFASKLANYAKRIALAQEKDGAAHLATEASSHGLGTDSAEASLHGGGEDGGEESLRREPSWRSGPQPGLHRSNQLFVHRSSSAQNLSSRVMRLKPSVISPESKYFLAWQQIILFFAAYSSVVTPLEFGFFKGKGLPLWWELLDIFINIVFIVDIGVSFCLAFKDRKTLTLVDDHKLIALRYIKTELLPDVLACMPWDSIYKATGKQEGYRFFDWFKIYRVRKVKQFFNRLEKDIRFNYFMVRITKLLVTEVFYTHVAACIFYYLATTIAPSHEGDTWIGSLTLGTDSYEHFRELSLGKRYVTSLYWAITTMATVGYGDIHPVNPREMVFAMFYISFDMIMGAYLLGNMTALIVRGSSTESFRDQMTVLRKYCHRNRVPRPLKRQMKAHVRLQYEMGNQEKSVIGDFPLSIRAQVLKAMHQPTIGGCYLFSGCSHEFISQIVSRLNVEHFMPGEIVINRKDASDQLYIIARGSVEELTSKDRRPAVAAVKGAGDVFGEVGVLCNIPQPFAVRVRDLTQLLRLEKQTLTGLLGIYTADSRQVVDNLLRRTKDADAAVRELSQEVTSMIDQQEAELAASFINVAASGDVERLKQLVKAGADPARADYDGRGALHLAAARGFDEVCRFLLSEGVDVNAKDNFGGTPLLEALKGGHDSTAAVLYSQGGVVSLDEAGSHLCNAVIHGNVEFLQRLLAHGVNPNSADYDQRTPLHIAAVEGFPILVKLLLAHGAEVGAADRWGFTPLDEARRSGSPPVVQLLEDAMRRRRAAVPASPSPVAAAAAAAAADGETSAPAQAAVADGVGGRDHGDSATARSTGGPSGTAPAGDGAGESNRGAGDGGGAAGPAPAGGAAPDRGSGAAAAPAGAPGPPEIGAEARDARAQAPLEGAAAVDTAPPTASPVPDTPANSFPREGSGRSGSERSSREFGEEFGGAAAGVARGARSQQGPVSRTPSGRLAGLEESPIAAVLAAQRQAISRSSSGLSEGAGGGLLTLNSAVMDAVVARQRTRGMPPAPASRLPRRSGLGGWGGRAAAPRARATLYGHHPLAPLREKRAGRLVWVPPGVEELLRQARDAFGGAFTRLVHEDGGEVTSTDVVVDGDRLFAVTAEDEAADYYQYHATCEVCKQHAVT